MKHNDNGNNETDTSMDTLDKGKEKWPDIIHLDRMEECGKKKHYD